MTDPQRTPPTPRRFFGIPPGPDVDRYYGRRTQELSALYPDIPNLSLHIPAHITIVPPFPSDNLDAIHAVAEEVARESRPFAITFGEFGNFGTETVYLASRNSPELNQLSHLLGTRLMDVAPSKKTGERNAFHPHVSLARYLTDDTYPRAHEFFERDMDHHFPPVRVDRFQLYRLDGDRYVVERIYLFA